LFSFSLLERFGLVQAFLLIFFLPSANTHTGFLHVLVALFVLFFNAPESFCPFFLRWKQGRGRPPSHTRLFLFPLFRFSDWAMILWVGKKPPPPFNRALRNDPFKFEFDQCMSPLESFSWRPFFTLGVFSTDRFFLNAGKPFGNWVTPTELLF